VSREDQSQHEEETIDELKAAPEEEEFEGRGDPSRSEDVGNAGHDERELPVVGERSFFIVGGVEGYDCLLSEQESGNGLVRRRNQL
jgi:hypothetical protein